MRAMHTTGRWGRVAVAAGSLGALLVTVGCSGTREASGVSTQASPAAASQTGLPIVVSCEPGQRTIVRPTMVNGTAMSQVECVAAEAQQPVAYAQALAQPSVAQPLATPIAYRTAAPQRVVHDVGRDVSDTEVVPVSTRASSARPVSARQIVYDERRVQRRTVQKSAVIIGSSAGVGAGVGAAVGGKKGALLGAVIGGGGATLWDQITRRKD
jgi:hypothetical protein